MNRATTGKAGTKADITYDDGDLRPDGTRTVLVNGTLPLGKPTAMYAYAVAEPSRFAASALTDMLRKRGIEILQTDLSHTDPQHAGSLAAMTSVAASYDADHLLAEHISPPLSEEVKVTLKVSQNLHASMTPFTLGAVLAHATKNIDQAGFDREHAFLESAGLDLTGAAQSEVRRRRLFHSGFHSALPDLHVEAARL